MGVRDPLDEARSLFGRFGESAVYDRRTQAFADAIAAHLDANPGARVAALLERVDVGYWYPGGSAGVEPDVTANGRLAAKGTDSVVLGLYNAAGETPVAGGTRGDEYDVMAMDLLRKPVPSMIQAGSVHDQGVRPPKEDGLVACARA